MTNHLHKTLVPGIAMAAAILVSTSPAHARGYVPSARSLERALSLDTANGSQAAYVRARVHLAQFRLDAAERVLRRMKPQTVQAAEIAWRLAHARGDVPRIAAAASRYCQAGDPTGRACVDAELYGAGAPAPSVELSGSAEVPLSNQAPFPITLASVGGVQSGVIFDTGASQTVVSRQLAEKLAMSTTRGTFPIGVAAGDAAVHASLSVLPELQLGKAKVRDLPVMVVDLPELDAAGIGVVLSPQQALDGLGFRIDFPRHRFSMWRGRGPAQIPGSVQVPYLAAGFDLVVLGRVGEGAQALFSFDTGMEGSCALARSYGTGQPQQILGTSMIQGAGAQAELQQVAAHPVQIGELVLNPQPGCLLSDMQRSDVLPIAGLLGNGLWAGRVVTFDTVAHRIAVSPSAPLAVEPAPILN